MSILDQEIIKSAKTRLEKMGFKIIFGKNVSKSIDDNYKCASIEDRVQDLHEAFADKNVKAILTVIGGYNVNQILDYIDYELIKENPKILCGFSDITALSNAIYAKTGLITYHGPHYSTFGFDKETEYTRQTFFGCLTDESPYAIFPSKAASMYHIIQEGSCEGTIIGGNLCTLNLLQGTPYMPDIRNKVLFLEDDNIMGEYFSYEFDRNLESLLQTEGAETIKGIIFGRFQEDCGMNIERITDIVRDKVPLNIPILFGVDFGHVYPFSTFPIGGTVNIEASNGNTKIVVVSH
jgi:muramoyltetrapeptide carboxypeptidase